MSIAIATLTRDDGTVVAVDGYAGGNGTDEQGHDVWARRWLDLGYSFTRDREALTLSRRREDGLTVTIAWGTR